jgi:hypothetical protein
MHIFLFISTPSSHPEQNDGPNWTGPLQVFPFTITTPEPPQHSIQWLRGSIFPEGKDGWSVNLSTQIHIFLKPRIRGVYPWAPFWTWHFSPENGDSMFLRNIGIYLQVHTALQPKNQHQHGNEPLGFIKGGNFMTNWRTISLSRRRLIRGVGLRWHLGWGQSLICTFTHYNGSNN